MSARKVVLAVALAAIGGCKKDDSGHGPPRTRSQDMNVTAVPPGPVGGTLGGRAFQTVQAWYRVVRMPGRERVDLIFSEGRPTRLCGESEPELSREVWVRMPGITTLHTGVLRVDPPASTPISVHYEWTVDDKWRGHGGGSAMLSVDEVSVGAVAGRVHICFDDTAQSCVEGSFRASECRNELDLDGPRALVRQREGVPPP